jgi:hypothetical protein
MAKFIPSEISEYVAAGKVWRLGLDYVSINADAYNGIGFTTPATGLCICSLSAVDKTGGEIVVAALEGPTLGSGTTLTPRNYNRVVGDASPPMTTTVYGGTTSGGTQMGSAMLGGTTGGAVKPGGAGSSAAFFVLKPSTVYYWQFTAKQATATMAAHIDFVYLDGQTL